MYPTSTSSYTQTQHTTEIGSFICWDVDDGSLVTKISVKQIGWVVG